MYLAAQCLEAGIVLGQGRGKLPDSLYRRGVLAMRQQTTADAQGRVAQPDPLRLGT